MQLEPNNPNQTPSKPTTIKSKTLSQNPNVVIDLHYILESIDLANQNPILTIPMLVVFTGNQKLIQYQCNVKPLGTKDLTGKSLTFYPQLQITQLLQLCPLTLELYLYNPNKMQGQTNRNIFKEYVAPSHISNSASKDIARNTNSNHNSQGRPGASREVEMAEATSSKRHSQTTLEKNQ
jgi:hypothetical protein